MNNKFIQLLNVKTIFIIIKYMLTVNQILEKK